jgi:hypothetical protein
VTFVSSYRLNVSYIFIGIADGVLHPNEVYPKGPFLLVKLNALADLVNHFRFLTVNQMKSICSAHGVITDARQSRSNIVERIANHRCDPICERLNVFTFKHLINDRKKMRPPALSKMKPREVMNHEHIEGVVDVDTDDGKFPPECSEDFRLAIIETWQAREKILLAGGSPCAICGQNHMPESMNEVDPDDIDFTLLRNPFLPDAALPTTYNMRAYDDAILYHKGLQCTDELGPVDMCCKCKRELVELGRQPLDSIANFMYYGLNELPDSVGQHFSKASMFDIMLVARSRATRITHLFSDKKGHPLEGSDPSLSQRYSRGNVAIMPQDSISLRSLLPPSSDEIAKSMCALFVGGKTIPTRENIEKLSPVLVSKQTVGGILEFLLT